MCVPVSWHLWDHSGQCRHLSHSFISESNPVPAFPFIVPSLSIIFHVSLVTSIIRIPLPNLVLLPRGHTTCSIHRGELKVLLKYRSASATIHYGYCSISTWAFSQTLSRGIITPLATASTLIRNAYCTNNPKLKGNYAYTILKTETTKLYSLLCPRIYGNNTINSNNPQSSDKNGRLPSNNNHIQQQSIHVPF